MQQSLVNATSTTSGAASTIRNHVLKTFLYSPKGNQPLLDKAEIGLYAPTSGQIYMDDVPMDEYAPALIHRKTSAVFQDFVRYKLTLKENIVFGCMDHAEDREAVHKAVVMSGTGKVLFDFALIYSISAIYYPAFE